MINAAKEWSDCELVYCFFLFKTQVQQKAERKIQIGYDLVDVQLPLQLLEPSIANRIEWWHGNLYVQLI